MEPSGPNLRLDLRRVVEVSRLRLRGSVSILSRFVAVLGIATVIAAPARVLADHGCSDERVSLPDGPGSIGGVGDNVDIDANMGSMSYSVPFELPEGYATATPSLGLSYSSGAGAGEVGVGWSLGVSSIERMRLRGLPEYTEADEFAVNGGSELVRVSASATSAVYRARNERGFVRYQWRSRGDGSAGYWIGERPNGTIDYYGADEAGNPVRSARVQTPTGAVYKYLLTTSVDVWGHAIRYRYVKDGETSLLDEVLYVDTPSGPRFSVRFAYETRNDTISTGEPGFVLTLTKRLREVQVRSGSETIRRYLLTYEAASSGVSRLVDIEQRGRGDATTPVRFTFSYSRALDGACAGDCAGPYMVDMGRLPAAVTLTGRSTLLDINGDALPDILETSPTGVHTWYVSRLDATTGTPSFEPARTSTATSSGSTFILGNAGVQVLDVDGDGFTDMIDAVTGRVLCNEGMGDWDPAGACLMNATLPTLNPDGAGDSDPRGVRFFDYDDDKRIDLVRTTLGITEVFVNTGRDFVGRAVEDIGYVFDTDRTLNFADMNGDGLQDPVRLSPGILSYRTNLGFGRWMPWQDVALDGFAGVLPENLLIEDINGDGLSDVLDITGTTVRFVVNENAGRFSAVRTLTSTDVTGDIPDRIPAGSPSPTTVLFADMNGSGSRDIVWINAGHVEFLELFPVKPNLLSRVENGLGAVFEVEYGTSVLQQARDAGTPDAWAYELPYPMNVVVAQDSWNRLFATETTGLHDTSTMLYRDGYYDGVERAFRGYGHVERIETSDLGTDNEVGSLSVFEYDLGVTDSQRYGLPLREARFGGAPGAWVPMLEERTTWSDCPVAEATSMTAIPVRWLCETRKDEIIQDGAPQTEWRTIRTDTTYDGYGSELVQSSRGVVHQGAPEAATACAACGPGVGPCGAECTGDEQFVETTYITPGTATGGKWILGAVATRSVYGDPAGPRTLERVYYDGEPFVGAALGQLGATTPRGAITRVEQQLDATTVLQMQRVQYDTHGNVVVEMGPDGAPDRTTTDRTVMTFDELGLRLARVDQLFLDRSGAPAALRREYTYEPNFYEVSESTAWMLVRGGSAVSARNSERYRYDAFGRPSAILRVGDTDAAPSEEYTYEPGSPVSRIITRERSRVGGALDTEEIVCVDGLGREVQSRTRLTSGSYQVSGFKVFNKRGKVIREYDAFLSESGACDMTAPTDVPYDTLAYDALQRPTVTTQATERVYGERTAMRIEYAPLRKRRFDSEDTNSAGTYANTPTVEIADGLGRVVALQRDLGGGEIETTTLDYDSLGRLIRVTAPDGVEQTQTHDLLGRVLTAEDPDRGMLRFTYDAEGRVIERVDARGRRTLTSYDALGRALSQWDPEAEAATRTETYYDEDPTCADCTFGAGRMVSARYPLGELGEGRDELSYDARGNIVFEARTLGGTRFVTRHTYDALGRRTRAEFPGGITFDETYDDASRIVGVSGVIDDIGYDAQGRMSTLFYANGVRTERSYDDAGRLEAVETRDTARVLQGVSIARDRMGNITALTDLSETAAPRPSLTGQFTYDAGYRLRRASFGEAASAEETLDFNYGEGDRVSGIVSSLGAASRAHTASITYDSVHPNAVAQADDVAYAYDAAGRMTRRGMTAYTHDYQGRMVSAASDDGDDAGRFFYGIGATRVARIENGSVTYYLGDQATVRDGVVTVHPRLDALRVGRLRSATIQTDVLSDVAPLAATDDEINAADAWVAVATAAGIVDGAPDASDPDALLAGAARRLLTLDGGDRAFLHQDHLGSTTLATDATGAARGEQLFYPTGALRHESGYVDDAGFSSQEVDRSTGLIAHHFRALDPTVGRWASPDPGFETQSAESAARFGEATTGYAYVGNHFGNATDPTGLAKVLAGIKAAGKAIGKGIGKAANAVYKGAQKVGSAIAKVDAWGNKKFGAGKWAVIKLGVAVTIGALTGGPAGAALAALGAVAGAVVGKAIGSYLRSESGRQTAQKIGAAWKNLDNSTGGKILKSVLVVGAAAGLAASMVYGGGALGSLSIPAFTVPTTTLSFAASTASAGASIIVGGVLNNVGVTSIRAGTEAIRAVPQGRPRAAAVGNWFEVSQPTRNRSSAVANENEARRTTGQGR